MNEYAFTFSDAHLAALPSGGLWWENASLLCVSDLHLGKSERFARRGGTLLPPYEVLATLDRLEDLIDGLSPRTVVCLGDSFDDAEAAQSLSDSALLRIARMQAGRDWIWIEGNHDPGPTSLAGRHLEELTIGPLTFRHILAQGPDISGHYHPKARLAGQSRPAFLVDQSHVVLPAFGAYTGGLSCCDPVFQDLMAENALAVLTGPRPVAVPLNRLAQSRGGKRPASTRFGR